MEVRELNSFEIEQVSGAATGDAYVNVGLAVMALGLATAATPVPGVSQAAGGTIAAIGAGFATAGLIMNAMDAMRGN